MGEAHELFSVLSYALARQAPSMTRHEQSLALESQVLETKGLNLRAVEFFIAFYLLIYFEVFNKSTFYSVWGTCHGAHTWRLNSGCQVWLQMLYQAAFLALLSIVLFCSSDYEGTGRGGGRVSFCRGQKAPGHPDRAGVAGCLPWVLRTKLRPSALSVCTQLPSL